MDQDNTDTNTSAVRTTQYKKFLVPGLVLLVVIGFVVGILYKKFHLKGQVATDSAEQEVSMADPVDIVLDFYGPWLEAVKSTSTDPYQSELATKKILSETLRTQLLSAEGHTETDIDPVLCQTTIPARVNGRIVSEQADVVRVLVTAKEKALTAQSVFTLKRHNDGWFIDSITCAPGEFELPREFSFEKEGFLLKSVHPPLDPQYWHIVFEDNGELGHAAPLFFSATSSCVALDKSTAGCDSNQFTEATKVHVYGQMTERGVDVTRLEFLE